MSAWGQSWGTSWGESWGADQPPAIESQSDGAVLRRRKRAHPPRLHPQEIARQQREDERYVAELEARTIVVERSTTEERRSAPRGAVVARAQRDRTLLLLMLS